jgi:purine catabolism regulator
MESTLTISGIIADPSLGTEIISGAGGIHRAVIWAHSCEMDNPAFWLQPHELLMTVGRCIPSGSQQQREFVASLDEAGLAGIALGDHGIAPRLTKAFFEESESRNFPVLRTAKHIAFTALSRMVAASNSEKTTKGVLQLAKLYQITAQRSRVEKRTGDPLSSLFSTPITVFDEQTKCVIIGVPITASPESAKRLIQLKNTPRPAVLHLTPGAFIDGFTLGHLIQVLEVDSTDIIYNAQHRVELGTNGFITAMLSRADSLRVMEQIWERDDPEFRALALELNHSSEIPWAIALAGINVLTHRGDVSQFLVVRERDIKPVRRIIEHFGLHAGVSFKYLDPGDINGAIEEASSQLKDALRDDIKWSVYGGGRVSLLARSASERAKIVSTVLGPLASDDPAIVPLRETLFAFLDNNQGWKETAAVLNVHRQSVVYRLNRVKELTGRDVHKTSDIVELFLARASWGHYLDDLAADSKD